MANGRVPAGRLSRRILTAAFVLLVVTAAAPLVLSGLGPAASQFPLETPEESFAQLSDTLMWAQIAAFAALACLPAGLFALAWFVRVRLETPLETLQQSLSAAAAGALAERVAGLERKDEIGAVARAAERFRQAALGEGGDDGLPGLQRLIERLGKDVVRLEADIARLSSATAHARTSIEESSIRAAKASHAAIEAAGIVRESARRIAVQAEDSVSLRRERASPVSPDEFDADDDFFETPPPGFACDTEADAVLTSLAGDLEALERFARDRKTIASEAAATLTVALVEAIDRLNGVADRISATADLGDKTQAA